MKVAITGGGTGGHIYPALAVGEFLSRTYPDVRVCFIGASGGMEERLAQSSGFPFSGVVARKIRRLISPDTVVTLLVLGRGWLQARRHLRTISPSVVLGTGGYVAAATVIAASGLGLPVVIHEQNAIGGRTNRWLARLAARVCLTYEESLPNFPRERAVVTGLPIRADLVGTVERGEAHRALGVPPESFMVLVLGGSQGAQALNKVVREAISRLPDNVFVLHQTGPTDADPCGSRERYRPVAFLDTKMLRLAYHAADLALSRCGASTLAELAVAGLPAMLVPYPAAYADHQTANARVVVRHGAAVLIPQAELTPARFVGEVIALMEDRERLESMARASAALARPNAAEQVGRLVIECAKK